MVETRHPRGAILLGEAVKQFQTVGLTRRGPPTCRHRREWLRHAEENFRRSYILSHLTLRAKVGGARRPSPTSSTDHRQPTTDLFPLPFKNQNSTIINRQFFICHAVGDKSAGHGYRVPMNDSFGI
jgi:hypothetical protein